MRGVFLAAITSMVQSAVAGTNPQKTPQPQTLPSLRDQATILDGWTSERKALIPDILRKYRVDAWLISQREYAEDTVYWALKEATMFSARRRTTQLYLANANVDGAYSYTWIENTDLVWKELRDILNSSQPSTIALNTASELAFSGGLHAGERDVIGAALGPQWIDRFVLEPMLGVEVIAHMVPSRLTWYKNMMETAWAIIEEGFSDAVITPGKTTTWDLEWWMRDKIQALNYTTWFQPSVFILGKTDIPATTTLVDDPRAPDHLINYGDIIHTDFGVTAMGLNTDTQHIGYVLYPGQTAADVPLSIVEGLEKANRLQNIVIANMEVGRTGNEILKRALQQARSEGIKGKIYCHATGEWGHSAGTVIGMTNLQDRVPVAGDLPLLKNTYYSIELYAEHFIPERNMTINFPLEEDVFWNNETETWEWVYGQQTQLILVHTVDKDTLYYDGEL